MDQTLTLWLMVVPGMIFLGIRIWWMWRWQCASTGEAALVLLPSGVVAAIVSLGLNTSYQEAIAFYLASAVVGLCLLDIIGWYLRALRTQLAKWLGQLGKALAPAITLGTFGVAFLALVQIAPAAANLIAVLGLIGVAYWFLIGQPIGKAKKKKKGA